MGIRPRAASAAGERRRRPWTQPLGKRQQRQSQLAPQPPAARNRPRQRHRHTTRPSHTKAGQFLLFGMHSVTAVVPVSHRQQRQNHQRRNAKQEFHALAILAEMASPGQSQFELNGLLQRLDVWSAGSGPLYRRLADAVRTAITQGDLSVGELLPPERLLARRLKISRSTVVAAYEILTDERLVERRQGSGTRVCAPASRPAAPSLPGTLNRNTLFRRIIDRPGGTIDLTGAYLLEPGGVPRELMQAAASETASLAETSGYSPLGYTPLREAIASHLSQRSLPTSPDQVL